MTDQLMYLIGTLLAWSGWTCLAIALFRLVDVSLAPAGAARSSGMQAAFKLLAVGAICLLLVTVLKMDEAFKHTDDIAGKWRFPLVWIVTPFVGWATLATFLLGTRGLVVAAQDKAAGLKSDPRSRTIGPRMRSAGGWLITSAVCAYLYRANNETFEAFRGGIYLAPATVGMILLLALATLGIMAMAGRAVKSRGVAKVFVSQLLLLIGCALFGMPFLWSVITSFKEDRDMSAANGLVWIPKVQETKPFRDPQDPLYATTFLGRSVQAKVVEREGDGTIKLDVQRPEVLRGRTLTLRPDQLQEIDQEAPVVSGKQNGADFKGMVVKELDNGKRRVEFLEPANLKGQRADIMGDQLEPVRNVGLRWQNYPEAIEYLPIEANYGLTYLRNTLFLVILSVIGTILSSSLVAYAFARLKFPGKGAVWTVLLSTMMLPAAVTLLPQFLIFKTLGWVDTLNPLWVPAFFGNAYFIFMLRQFFSNVPMELEDASKVDGCSYLRSYWSIMLPQVKPALAVVAIWTFMGVWNNFQGPLVYINSPEKMPIIYALQLFQGDRFGEPGLLMAFAVLTVLPVLALFFVAQRYFIEGVSLSGLGGR